MGEQRSDYEDLLGKPDGQRLLRRPRSRWEDNIKVGLKGMGREGVDWIRRAQGRDQWWAPVGTVMDLQVTQNSGHFIWR
jgi:hypothetical protein